MQEMAKMIEGKLPKETGFVLLTFEFNKQGELIYVSNANRENVVEAMKEFIVKTEKTYGNDTGKY